MEQLIPVINKLHDVFSLVEGGSPIDLPQIVVVGSQSSGKSSVLEHIVGKDFLPRGSGIVTRRPLILQLIHLDNKKSKGNDLDSIEWNDGLEWGEFLHKPNEKYFEFSDIREEIQRETDRLTGKNKGISPIPINLKIYSPHVLNLTLVDLPGITKVPVGDQPKDIEVQLRKLVLTYITKPNTVILAVSSANTDLTNSDALQIARDVDPEGKRTLGVITKLDLMDKGTDALDVLQGKVVPLRLGYIGVINRSQKDINENKPISEALKNEKFFFQNHPAYRSVASRCGTQFLSQTLNRLLINHIKNCLPDLKNRVSQMLTKTTDELRSYGDPNMDISKGALLLQTINYFASSYNETIEGKITDDKSTSVLYGGARINYIFNDLFTKYLNSLSATDGLTPFDVRTAISNATGPKAALFVPEGAFEALVRRQISRFRDPCLQCVDLVFDELEKIVHSIQVKEFERFANLKDTLLEEAINLLRACRTPSKDMINHLVNMELSFINTNHPDFKLDEVIGSVMQRRAQHQQQAQQAIEQDKGPVLPPKDQAAKGKASVPVPAKVEPQPAPQQNYPPQNYGATSPGDKAGFFNMFFSGGAGGANPGAKKPTENSAINNNKLKSYYGNGPQANYGQPSKSNNYYGNQAPLTLDQVPSTLTITAIPQEKEFEIELLEALLEKYFGIVKKTIQDMIPKIIMYFMVSKSKSEMQNELIKNLYKETNFDYLFSEASDVQQKRQKCKQQLDILSKASYILNEIRDFSIPSTGSVNL